MYILSSPKINNGGTAVPSAIAIMSKTPKYPEYFFLSASDRNLSARSIPAWTSESVIKRSYITNIHNNQMNAGHGFASVASGAEKTKIMIKHQGISPIAIQGNLRPHFLVNLKFLSVK